MTKQNGHLLVQHQSHDLLVSHQRFMLFNNRQSFIVNKGSSFPERPTIRLNGFTHLQEGSNVVDNLFFFGGRPPPATGGGGEGGVIWLDSLAWPKSASRLHQPTRRLKSVGWVITPTDLVVSREILPAHSPIWYISVTPQHQVT